MIKTIFFDFDGTLLDSWDLAVRAFERTLRELDVEYSEDDFKLLGMKMVRILEKLGVSGEEIESGARLFFDYFIDEARGANLKCCVSEDVLRELGEKYKLIVVSNARKEYLDLAIGKMGISEVFDEIYGAEEGKSKAEILDELISKLGVLKGECLYVGDRFSDVRFAREVGIKVIAISNKYSWSSREELEEESPDFLIGDLEELVEIIEELNKE